VQKRAYYNNKIGQSLLVSILSGI